VDANLALLQSSEQAPDLGELSNVRHTRTVFTNSTLPRQSGRVPAGLIGWRRASCLGCNRRVVQTRDSWVCIGGTRTGSYLLTWGAEPFLVYATDSNHVPQEPLFLLGVAHRRCVDAARTGLENGSIRLPAELPTLQLDQGEDLPEPPYTLHMPTQPNACPFCDSTAELTLEHIWPVWYSKELQAYGATLVGEHATPDRIEVTIPVCRTCNNTWMSVLETDTAPLLTRMMKAGAGRIPRIALTPLQQARVATWAIKTAYLIDAYQQPVTPRGFLHRLALQRTPNESAVVWVAAYTPDVAARSEKHALHLVAGRDDNSPDGFAVTFTIFNVLFQVVEHFSAGPANVRDNRQQYDIASFRIWPRSDSGLTWPPAVGFSRPSWDDLVASVSVGAQ
jgi:hypothetical protein